MVKNRRNILFTIGIDSYQFRVWDNLNNAVFDTKTLIDILTNRYGFELYPEPLYNEEATKERIYRSFNELKQFADPEDNLIIIFAGHGQMHQQTQRGYWVPHEGMLSPETLMENSVIKDFIEDIDAKHIWLISDSCFSGTFLTKTRGILEEKRYTELDSLKSRWMLASGKEEKVSDGQPGQHSPFSQYLIKYLETNENSYTSATEIIRYVSFMTANNSKQSPRGATIDNIQHEGGEIVLTLNRSFVKTKIDETKGTTHTASLRLEQIQNQKKKDSLAAGKEILLVKSLTKKSTYLVFENFRFDDEGNKKIPFENENCRLCWDNGFDLIQRFATMKGCSRYIEQNIVADKDAEIVIVKANMEIDNVEETPYAILQAELLEELLSYNKDPMICLHCGERLISNNSSMIEIDEKYFPENVGNVHNKCLRRSDRILGIAGFRNPVDFKFLDFDIVKWADLLEIGQGQINGQKKHFPTNIKAIIAWNSANFINEGPYCIKSNFEDGSSSYVKKGKDIHRFKEYEIDSEVLRFNQTCVTGEQEGNPFAKIVGTEFNGLLDFLLQHKTSEQSITKVVSFEKAKYSKQFDIDSKRFDNDYAPLGLIQYSDSGETVKIDNIVPLITNPLHFDAFYKNWNIVGAKMARCKLKIISSDLELDFYLKTFFKEGLLPVLDPMFEAETKKILSGFPIQDIDEILNAGKRKVKWQAGDRVKIILSWIDDGKYPSGILLTEEFINDHGEESVIFRPIEDGIEIPDLQYIVPTILLDNWN